MGDHTLFFYGTLMAPQILHRVIHGQATPEPWQKALLTIEPAILYGYRRHRVRNADYPGVIPAGSSSSSTERRPATNTSDETSNTSSADNVTHKYEHEHEPSVLGTLVSGLTDGDIYRLDKFEGLEYAKRAVKVRLLRSRTIPIAIAGEEQNIKNTQNSAANSAHGSQEEEEEVEAVTYVWIAGEEMLEDQEWNYEDFKREKLAWWVGARLEDL